MAKNIACDVQSQAWCRDKSGLRYKFCTNNIPSQAGVRVIRIGSTAIKECILRKPSLTLSFFDVSHVILGANDYLTFGSN